MEDRSSEPKRPRRKVLTGAAAGLGVAVAEAVKNRLSFSSSERNVSQKPLEPTQKPAQQDAGITKGVVVVPDERMNFKEKLSEPEVILGAEREKHLKDLDAFLAEFLKQGLIEELKLKSLDYKKIDVSKVQRNNEEWVYFNNRENQQSMGNFQMDTLTGDYAKNFTVPTVFEAADIRQFKASVTPFLNEEFNFDGGRAQKELGHEVDESFVASVDNELPVRENNSIYRLKKQIELVSGNSIEMHSSKTRVFRTNTSI